MAKRDPDPEPLDEELVEQEQSPVGEQLRLAREAKKLSLEDVAAQTRIPLRHLASIETGDWDNLPAPTYTIGFAKSYASAVGLDRSEVGNQLREEMGGQRFATNASDVFEPADPRRTMPKGLVIGAIVAVVVLTVMLGGLIVLSNRDILMPMRRLIATIDRLADGDLASDIPLATRRDELGDVARALQHFRTNAIEKERLQKQEREDLEFARRIQLASVPRRFPAFPDRGEIDICGRLAPTRAVGGDFFDFYLMAPDRLVIAIGDASGKGVASAMFVGMARSALKSEAVRTAEPEICLTEANRTIAADNESMMFMTTFYAVLDLRTGELAYANAGHTQAYLLGPERGVRPLVADPGLPLGVVEDFRYLPHHHRLAPGEAVVLYTDGVTEAAAVDGTLFGERRLEEVLARPRTASCETIVGEVFDAVMQFSKGAAQADDIAILVVRYKGMPAELDRSPSARSAAEAA